jgi:phosphate transport system substrate-binding protein
MKNSWPGALALAAFLAACGGGKALDAKDAAPAGGSVSLTGAGATFPAPVYGKWFSDYGQAHGVQVNYQSIGSGGGIQQVTAGTVDFGASDAPMSAEEEAKVPGILQLPTVLGAVAVTYNLPGLAPPLKLSGPVLAGIFAGKVTKWNDPAIAADNPGAALPATNIAVVHRSDGSGTTYVWVDYLAKVSPEWKRYVGVGTQVEWPVGESVKGCEGVAGRLKESPGAIGYVEMLYALQNSIPFGRVRNREGAFVEAGPQSVRAAAESCLAGAPEDLRFSLTDAPGEDSYPISGACWAVVYANQPADGGRSLFDFLSWCTHEGQAYAESLGYVALPPVLKGRLERQLNRVSHSH